MSGNEPAYLSGTRKQTVAPDVNVRNADQLAKLLDTVASDEVAFQIADVLKKRDGDWDDAELATIHKVLSDIMWERV